MRSLGDDPLSLFGREFIRERPSSDFLRREFKGSADHLDKAAGFYPSLGPAGFDVSPMSLDAPADPRRALAHRANTPTHLHPQGAVASHAIGHPHDAAVMEKKLSAKVESERKSKGTPAEVVLVRAKLTFRLEKDAKCSLARSFGVGGRPGRRDPAQHRGGGVRLLALKAGH